MNPENIFDELLKNLTSAGDHQKASACQWIKYYSKRYYGTHETEFHHLQSDKCIFSTIFKLCKLGNILGTLCSTYIANSCPWFRRYREFFTILYGSIWPIFHQELVPGNSQTVSSTQGFFSVPLFIHFILRSLSQKKSFWMHLFPDTCALY